MKGDARGRVRQSVTMNVAGFVFKWPQNWWVGTLKFIADFELEDGCLWCVKHVAKLQACPSLVAGFWSLSYGFSPRSFHVRFVGYIEVFFIFQWLGCPSGPGRPRYRVFAITLRHTTFGRTPLENWSARRRDLYLTTHNSHKRQTSMPPGGFEPTVLASERLQPHAWDRAASGIGT
jgi:hypothetical protein